MASGRAYLDKGDSRAAIIELKNALRKEADLPEARFLLGKAFLESGDAVSAEVELKKAIDLHYPDAQVLPEHARALLALGRHKEVIDLYGSPGVSEPKAVAELHTAVATAYAMQENKAKAAEEIDAALREVPGFAPALLLRAQLAVQAKDFDRALALVDEILKASPNDYLALQMRGTLMASVKSNLPEAVASFEKALAIRPDLPAAHAGLFQAHVARQDVDAAQRQLAAMKRVLPNHPQVRFLEAQLAYLRNDHAKARELSQQLLKSAPEDPAIMQLAAAAELRSGSAAQAETLLIRALKAEPGLVMARALLSEHYLRTGRSSEALHTILPGAQSPDADAATLTLAGQAYVHAGDLAQAQVYFERAAKLNPEPRARTALALTRLAMGSGEGTFAELESISAGDAGVTADLALVVAHMRRGEFPAAMAAVDKVEQKQPGKPLAPMLRGRVQLAANDAAGARKSFDRALEIDPGYFPAAAQLAALDVRDKRPDLARKRMEGVLRADPKHLQALLMVAQLRAREGAHPDEVAAMLADAVKLHPRDPAPRLMLIDHHMRQNNLQAALTAAQEAASALPDNLGVLDMLGRLQLASGDMNQALGSFGKLASALPDSAEGLFKLAEVQVAAKDPEAAMRTARKAASMAPDSAAARQRLVSIALVAGRSDEALAEARTLQRQRPADALGFMLEGDVHAHRKSWSAAVGAYREALRKSDLALVAARLHASLIESGTTAEADKFAAGWVKQHPQDAFFLSHLGDTLLARNNLLAAEARYAQVVRLQPDNPVALNNLAWVMARNGKPEALAHAEKANRLRPNQPSLLDTLASALVQADQLEKAIAIQRKAVDLAPENPGLRLNLAKMYLKARRDRLAKAELAELSKLGDKFSRHAEVAQLLKSL